MTDLDYSKIKQAFLREIDQGLDDILAEGFGRIDVIVDLSRDLCRIEITPHKRRTITRDGKAL